MEAYFKARLPGVYPYDTSVWGWYWHKVCFDHQCFRVFRLELEDGYDYEENIYYKPNRLYSIGKFVRGGTLGQEFYRFKEYSEKFGTRDCFLGPPLSENVNGGQKYFLCDKAAMEEVLEEQMSKTLREQQNQARLTMLREVEDHYSDLTGMGLWSEDI